MSGDRLEELFRSLTAPSTDPATPRIQEISA